MKFKVSDNDTQGSIGITIGFIGEQGSEIPKFLRTVFFFSMILSTVAVGLMFSSLYYPTYGLINSILTWIGLGSITPDRLRAGPGCILLINAGYDHHCVDLMYDYLE